MNRKDPVVWTNQPLLLYHGTVDIYEPSLKRGIDINLCRPGRDFGQGFYTTTKREQAVKWAIHMQEENEDMGVDTRPIVMEFSACRDEIAVLETLYFVRGAIRAEDYWSFICHCRSERPQHGRTNSHFYDVVVGPVTYGWTERKLLRDSDQISFHTEQATKKLRLIDSKLVPPKKE